MLVIDWRHDGRKLLLPMTLYRSTPANDLDGVDAVALVDTGSTISGIAKSIASSLGLSRRGKRPLGSAQGEAQAERYLFKVGVRPDQDEGAPPAFPFIFDAVVGFELKANFQFSALLGMDILSQCDLSMDRSGRCSLRVGR